MKTTHLTIASILLMLEKKEGCRHAIDSDGSILMEIKENNEFIEILPPLDLTKDIKDQGEEFLEALNKVI